jgi:hypothetical protein
MSALITLVAMLVAAPPCGHAQAEPLRVGVFDQAATGGQGASVDGLMRGLADLGYSADRMTDLGTLTLLRYDVVYLSDMHSPGRVQPDWRTAVQSFVEAGGSVLQTWHHHFLGQVGVGIQRVYGSRGMHVVPGHPAVTGVTDFDSRYEDHIIEKVGPNGTVILTNGAGQPVAVAGELGKGKVISTGLALAIPDGNSSTPPKGAEVSLLKAFLGWLTPTVPRADRLARALQTPRLEVSPAEALTAAGFPVEFRAVVGSASPADVALTCEGATVAPDPAAESSGALPLLRTFRLSVTTEPRRDGEQECTVRAKVGGKSLEQEVRVRAVYGAPSENEVRGVWLHVAAGKHPKLVMPELRQLGLNMAVLRIAGGTAAFYGSKVQPDIQDPLAPDGDWLAETAKYAKANDIRIHPYVNNCIVEGRTSPESLKRLRDAGRLQESSDGRPIDWFCPSQEINFDAMERVMLEIATQYGVDGVQYDFIRYPNDQGCFCAKCRERFERETGKPVANWPKDVVNGDRHSDWVEFRCGRISALVQRISTRLRKEAPKVKISAAVFSGWPGCRESVGQDWVRWCKEGWLDFVCPMNYTLDAKLFEERCKVHREALPKGFPLVEGIGIAAGNGNMHSPNELATQIALARRSGAEGFLGFAYQPTHTTSLFEPLREWLRGE